MRHAARSGLIAVPAVALSLVSMMCNRRDNPATTRSGAPQIEGAWAPASPQPPQPGRLAFLALGDSYTIGQSVAVADRWPVQLAERLRERGLDVGEPVILARTGWTTGDLLEAMDRAKLSGKYALVMLLIGVNNQFQGRSEEEYRQQFVELLNRAIALGGGDPRRVVVLSIPDWSVTPFGNAHDAKRMSAEVARFNAINCQQSQRAGVRYVDITPESRDAATQSDMVADDGLHPSRRQYGQWAALSLDAAAAALATPTPSTAAAATRPAS